MQGTGGSSAIANSWEQLRRAGATARAMLIAAAAEAWQVPAAEITVDKGVLSHARTGRRATFGELAAAAARQTPPANVTLKDPKDFKLIGRRAPRVDSRAKTDGSALFTFDVRLPDMLTAVIARPPRFGATVKSFDASEARRVSGVTDVVQVPAGVAVVARGTWAAINGRRALRVEWDETAAETRGSEELFTAYRALATQPGARARWQGDAPAALASAARVLDAVYEFPYLAHTPMEPLDCVVRLAGDICEVWLGSQMPTVDQQIVARVVGLPPDKVRVHTLLAGGSFGRRATPYSDVAAEAASIAKALGGARPVKLVWTREDDVQGGFYRRSTCTACARASTARAASWPGSTASSASRSRWGRRTRACSSRTASIARRSRGRPACPMPFRTSPWSSIPRRRACRCTRGDRSAARIRRTRRRCSSTRSPARSGAIPWIFGGPCCKGVRATWACWSSPRGRRDGDSPVSPGRARGVAVHECFGSVVAQIAEVSLDATGVPKVERVVCAVDCGIAVNPDVVRAQMEGGIGFGLGAALWSEITVVGGRVQQSNFHDYRILRIEEMPRVEVHIVPSATPPTGVGEPGVPPIAPAVGNAVLALTGRPPRRLPFARLASEPKRSSKRTPPPDEKPFTEVALSSDAASS